MTHDHTIVASTSRDRHGQHILIIAFSDLTCYTLYGVSIIISPYHGNGRSEHRPMIQNEGRWLLKSHQGHHLTRRHYVNYLRGASRNISGRQMITRLLIRLLPSTRRLHDHLLGYNNAALFRRRLRGILSRLFGILPRFLRLKFSLVSLHNRLIGFYSGDNSPTLSGNDVWSQVARLCRLSI